METRSTKSYTRSKTPTTPQTQPTGSRRLVPFPPHPNHNQVGTALAENGPNAGSRLDASARRIVRSPIGRDIPRIGAASPSGEPALPVQSLASVRRALDVGRLFVATGLAVFVGTTVLRGGPSAGSGALATVAVGLSGLVALLAAASLWSGRDRLVGGPAGKEVVATTGSVLGATLDPLRSVLDVFAAASAVAATGGPASPLDLAVALPLAGLVLRPGRRAAATLVGGVGLAYALACALASANGGLLYWRAVDVWWLFARLAGLAGLGLLVSSGRQPSAAPIDDSQSGQPVTPAVAPERGNLIAMMSHDLRTPLTSIKGFSQLILRDQSLTPTTRHYADMVLAETNRAVRTIADAVDLARIHRGHADLRIELVSLCSLIPRAVAELRHHDPDRRVRIELPTTLPTVRADATRVERVVAHLVGSSLRYSAGTTPIVIGAAPAELDGRPGVNVWVADHGYGIPEAKFAHIFDLDPTEPRVQVGSVPITDAAPTGAVPTNDDCSDDADFNASGLGLFISKQLIEAQGGRIWVERGESGRGSRIAFWLGS